MSVKEDLDAQPAGTVIGSGSDFTTSSSTYVDLTNAAITLMTREQRCLLIFTSRLSQTNSSNAAVLTVSIDGVTQTDVILMQNLNVSGNGSFSYLTDVLTAGSHTFKIRVRQAVGGTVTVNVVSVPWRFSVIGQ